MGQGLGNGFRPTFIHPFAIAEERVEIADGRQVGRLDFSLVILVCGRHQITDIPKTASQNAKQKQNTAGHLKDRKPINLQKTNMARPRNTTIHTKRRKVAANEEYI